MKGLQELKVSVSSPTETTRELVIEVPPERVASAIEEETEKVRKKVQIPGFRKGKAPRGMIRTQYGRQIEATAIETAINNNYKEAVDREKLFPIGPADISNMDYELGLPLKFTAKIEIEPEFSIDSYKGMRVEKEESEPSPEMIEDALKKIQLQFGTVTTKEGPAERGDQLLVDIAEIDPATSIPLIGKRYPDKSLRIGDNMYGDEFDEQLIGVTKGETKRVLQRIEQYIIQNPNQNRRQGPTEAHYKVTVKKIEAVNLPEINDDLAKELKFKNLEAMREGMKANLQLRMKENAAEKMRGSLEREIIRIVDPPVPSSMVDRYVELLSKNIQDQQGRKPDSEEIQNEIRKVAQHKVKWFLIRQKIVDQEKLAVTDAEIEEYLENFVSLNKVDAKRLSIEYRSGKKRDDLKNSLLDKKVYEFLESKTEVSTVKVNP